MKDKLTKQEIERLEYLQSEHPANLTVEMEAEKESLMERRNKYGSI